MGTMTTNLREADGWDTASADGLSEGAAEWPEFAKDSR
jgi:hypothetical protein